MRWKLVFSNDHQNINIFTFYTDKIELPINLWLFYFKYILIIFFDNSKPQNTKYYHASDLLKIICAFR